MNDAPVVIVGAGLAGYTLAKELRKLAPDLPITLVTADSGALYSKPMLSNALAQGQSPEQLVQAAPQEQADKLGLTLLAHRRVTQIDRTGLRLITDQGPIPYRHLVLALGARPRQPWFPGAELAISVNHLDHYARFRQALQPGAHVCIIGAGLVGCEFANDLLAAGHPVTLVESSDRPLGQMAPEPIARRLRDGLAGQGATWHCGTGVAGVSPQGAGYRVRLENGVEILADLVLAAIGLEPETDLARQAGLAVERGIRVDCYLTTTDLHISALGDCAQVKDMVLPYILPLMQQARALAANLTGNPARLSLPALPVVVKTPACPLVLCPPPPGRAGAWHQERDDAAGAVSRYLDPDGALLGFALAGDACGQRRQLAGQTAPLLG